MTHSTKTSPMTAGESENGGRSRRKSMYEKTPMKEKNSPAPGEACGHERAVGEQPAQACRATVPPTAGPLASGGSERRMTNVAASGSAATAPRATRQVVAAVTSATPTRPTRPPNTSAETYRPMARAPMRSA